MNNQNFLEPFEPLTLTYSMQDLFNLNKANKLNFEIEMQRGLKWRDTKANNYKSMLIYSILLNVDINKICLNAVFTNPKQKTYEVLDGQQRLKGTVFGFMSGEFCLQYLPLYKMGFGDDAEIIDLNGKSFDKLPDELKGKISNYKPSIVYYENLTKRQKEYVFIAINNGMALTNSEKSKAKIKDQSIIAKLAKHKIFLTALSWKAVNNSDDQTIIKHMWTVLNYGGIGLTDQIYVPLIENADITDVQQKSINEILDRLFICHNIIHEKAKNTKQNDKIEAKKLESISKKFLKKSHIVSITPIVKDSIDNNVSEQILSAWIIHFFNSRKSTISEKYNETSTGGSNSPAAISARLEAATSDYKQFIDNHTNKQSTDSGEQQEEVAGQSEEQSDEQQTEE